MLLRRRPTLLLLLAFALAAGACTNADTMYQKGSRAEAEGDLEEARTQYLAVVRLLPDSDRSEEARASFVRLTLSLAEEALTEENPMRARAYLEQARGLVDGKEGRRLVVLENRLHALESAAPSAVTTTP